jgi:hypothetical protein
VYLARFTCLSRTHALSDLRIFLAWCAERDVEPLAGGRVQNAVCCRYPHDRALLCGRARPIDLRYIP